MIIGRAMLDEGGEYLLLGLTTENLRRLKQGQPIRLTTETHGAGVPLGWRILLVHGETEKDLVNALRDAGVMSADTKVQAMPRGAKEPGVV